MNVENFFKPPQEGGPTEKETMELKDSLIEQGKLSSKATLFDLVKYMKTASPAKTVTQIAEEKNRMSSVAVPSEQAKGGKVKKKKKKGYSKNYANGGTIRKPSRV